MAKNTFFIRAQVNAEDDASFYQAEIDLGSYTNLGSSKPEVLRIHEIQAFVHDSDGEVPNMTGDKAETATWQLTTQTQADLVTPLDDSYVAGAMGAWRNPDSETGPPSQSFVQQLLAQDWQNGYVVAVPSLFLGGLTGPNWAEDVYISLIMECSTEAMTKANAVSLAVSQQ